MSDKWARRTGGVMGVAVTLLVLSPSLGRAECVNGEWFRGYGEENIPKPCPPVGARPVAGVVMPSRISSQVQPGPAIHHLVADSVLFVTAQPSDAELTQAAANGTGARIGSAVAISPTVAMTDCHVVLDDFGSPSPRDMAEITVRSRAMLLPVRAKVIFANPDIDICFVQVAAPLRPIAGIRRVDYREVGEKVYSYGNPRGLEFSWADGVVAAYRSGYSMKIVTKTIMKDGEKVPVELKTVQADVIQFTSPISEGSSGGALLDRFGNLIGITQSVVEGGENINFAIDASMPWKDFISHWSRP